MSVKNNHFWTLIRILRDFIPEIMLWNKYCIDLCDDSRKIEVDLTIRLHALEKGMSLGHVRQGFGQSKVLVILEDLKHYYLLGGEKQFVQESINIISQYISFNEFTNEMEVVKNYHALCSEFDLAPIQNGTGICRLEYSNLFRSIHSEFYQFSQSRHAIRDFGSTPIDNDAIKKALLLCERTPSACNRQPWHIYVIENKQKRDAVMEIQGGVSGCNEEIQSAIMICADMHNYGSGENNLPYVDGGIYAMNLMYALHYYGLANIPLSMSYHKKRVDEMKKILGVPEYELPVLLIAIGSYKDCIKVASSIRKNYNNYTTTI